VNYDQQDAGDEVRSQPLPHGVSERMVELAGVPCILCIPRDRLLAHRIIHAGASPFKLKATAKELSRLAFSAGCEVVAPLYRSSAEHSIQKSVADVLAVYQEALSQHKTFTAETRPRVFLSGELKGAAVVVAVATVVRELELQAPEGLVLLTRIALLGTPDEAYLRCDATRSEVWHTLCLMSPEFDLCARDGAHLFSDLSWLSPVLLQATCKVPAASTASVSTAPLAPHIAPSRSEAPTNLVALLERLASDARAAIGSIRAS
jgi:acetyl esterase/lipase